MQFALASAALAPLVQNIKWQPACRARLPAASYERSGWQAETNLS
jgi:hypothetical protein